MNETSRARSAAAWTGRLIGRHKVISSVSAVFVAASIAVSIATTGSAAPQVQPQRQPAAHGFTLPALGRPGQRVSLAQYQGKPVILNFWAAWCPPCQQETPLLASWYKQQGGNVVLLGLDENDTVAAATKFAAAKGVSYPIGFDQTTTVALDYNVDDLPQTFFLNAQHRIVEHVLGAVTRADLAKGLSLMRAGHLRCANKPSRRVILPGHSRYGRFVVRGKTMG
jgi:cytochrome c biogenesis protein CcmG, thiol:disulfide interchange protein DsbE